MVIFDDRRKTFEERFRHEEDLRFKITARSNRLLGEWAAARLGLLGAQGDDYANSVVHAQFEEPGVVAKVGIDLRTKGIVSRAQCVRAPRPSARSRRSQRWQGCEPESARTRCHRRDHRAARRSPLSVACPLPPSQATQERSSPDSSIRRDQPALAA